MEVTQLLRRTVLAAAIASSALAAGPTKMPADLVRWLETARPGDNAEVIVQFKQGPGKAEHDKVTALGGTLLRTLAVINSAVYKLPAGKLSALAADSGVLRVSPNRGVSVQNKQAGAGVLVEGDR